jgi:hypothetical protein
LDKISIIQSGAPLQPCVSKISRWIYFYDISAHQRVREKLRIFYLLSASQGQLIIVFQSVDCFTFGGGDINMILPLINSTVPLNFKTDTSLRSSSKVGCQNNAFCRLSNACASCLTPNNKPFSPDNNQHDDKYWPPVGRIDNDYGDRHMVCTCPPLPDYE